MALRKSHFIPVLLSKTPLNPKVKAIFAETTPIFINR